MLSLKEKANTLVVVHFAPLGIAVGLANPPHPNPQEENKPPTREPDKPDKPDQRRALRRPELLYLF